MEVPATDLLYRRLDGSGDYVMGEGEHTLLSNIEAITQAINTRLKHLRGEWWENRKDGLPLWQEILGQPQTSERKNIVDLLVIERITDTRGVTGVREVDSFFAPRERTYTFTCTADTIYGEAALEVNF